MTSPDILLKSQAGLKLNIDIMWDKITSYRVLRITVPLWFHFAKNCLSELRLLLSWSHSTEWGGGLQAVELPNLILAQLSLLDRLRRQAKQAPNKEWVSIVSQGTSQPECHCWLKQRNQVRSIFSTALVVLLKDERSEIHPSRPILVKVFKTLQPNKEWDTSSLCLKQPAKPYVIAGWRRDIVAEKVCQLAVLGFSVWWFGILDLLFWIWYFKYQMICCWPLSQTKGFVLIQYNKDFKKSPLWENVRKIWKDFIHWTKDRIDNNISF